MTSADIPPVPEGVCLVHGNLKTETICTLRYEGLTEDGQHLWLVITPGVQFDPARGDHLKIALLPGNTALQIESPEWMGPSDHINHIWVGNEDVTITDGAVHDVDLSGADEDESHGSD